MSRISVKFSNILKRELSLNTEQLNSPKIKERNYEKQVNNKFSLLLTFTITGISERFSEHAVNIKSNKKNLEINLSSR